MAAFLDLSLNIQPSTFVLVLSQFLISRLLGHRSVKKLEMNEALLDETHDARGQMEQLFAMTGMLHRAESHEDAGAVLEATAKQ